MNILKFLTIILNLSIINIYAKNNNDISELDEREDLSIKNYVNITRLENILNVFDIHVIGSNWININSKISKRCAFNMMEYLNGLQEKKIWAMKSEYIQ